MMISIPHHFQLMVFSNVFVILGDEAASFTKEEMQQGKHTDYERLLHEQLIVCQSQKEAR